MVKVLAQAGISLADVYDVEGSIAGVDQLDVTEVKAVHDLGPQIHSERLLSVLIQQNSTALAQNLTWNLTTGNFPDSVARMFGMALFADVAGRLTSASVHITDTDTGREMPLFAWESVTGVFIPTRWSNNGAAVATLQLLRPGPGAVNMIPTLLTRMGGSGQMPTITFRGVTAGFGAGTVTCFLVYHIARPNRVTPVAGDPSSHGLPIPGW